MIGEDDYEASSGDVGVDFTRLETKYRSKLFQNLEISDNGNSYVAYHVEYINHVLAAADTLGIDLFEGISVPYHKDHNVDDVSQRVQTISDNFKVRVNISRVHGRSTFSIQLSSQEKQHIRTLAEQIKREIEESQIDPDLKRDLLDALNVFLSKLDRDRTPLQGFTDYVLTTSATLAVAGENLEGWWKWIAPIAAIFGVNVQSNQMAVLKPKSKVQIGYQKTRFLNKPDRPESNDDVPF